MILGSCNILAPLPRSVCWLLSLGFREVGFICFERGLCISFESLDIVTVLSLSLKASPAVRSLTPQCRFFSLSLRDLEPSLPSLRGHASLQPSGHRVSGRRDFYNPEKLLLRRPVQRRCGKLLDPIVHLGCSYHPGLALVRTVERESGTEGREGTEGPRE